MIKDAIVPIIFNENVKKLEKLKETIPKDSNTVKKDNKLESDMDLLIDNVDSNDNNLGTPVIKLIKGVSMLDSVCSDTKSEQLEEEEEKEKVFNYYETKTW